MTSLFLLFNQLGRLIKSLALTLLYRHRRDTADTPDLKDYTFKIFNRKIYILRLSIMTMLSQSLKTTIPNNLYHPNQLSIRCVV